MTFDQTDDATLDKLRARLEQMPTDELIDIETISEDEFSILIKALTPGGELNEWGHLDGQLVRIAREIAVFYTLARSQLGFTDLSDPLCPRVVLQIAILAELERHVMKGLRRAAELIGVCVAPIDATTQGSRASKDDGQ